LPVREPLASRTLYRKDYTFPIVETKLDAVIVPEIEFREIPLQTLLFAMLIGAAPFQGQFFPSVLNDLTCVIPALPWI
jgi:hypothetical protein